MKKILLFLMGLSISVISAWFIGNDMIFFRSAKIGHGIAVKTDERSSYRGRKSWDLVACFTPDGGSEVLSHPYRSSFPPEVNQNVKFFYDPAHPEDVREIKYIESVRYRQILGFFGGVFLMLMAFVGGIGKKAENDQGSPFKRGLWDFIVISATFMAIIAVVYVALLGFLLLLGLIRRDGSLNWISFFVGVFLMLMAFAGDIWKKSENSPASPFKRGLRIFNIILGSILAGYVARESFYLIMARTDMVEELRLITFMDMMVGPLSSFILYLLFHKHVARFMNRFTVVTYLITAVTISLYLLTLHFNEVMARDIDPFLVFLR